MYANMYTCIFVDGDAKYCHSSNSIIYYINTNKIACSGVVLLVCVLPTDLPAGEREGTLLIMSSAPLTSTQVSARNSVGWKYKFRYRATASCFRFPLPHVLFSLFTAAVLLVSVCSVCTPTYYTVKYTISRPFSVCMHCLLVLRNRVLLVLLSFLPLR